MPQVARSEETENGRIVLGLLESIERDGSQSQRKRAADLGIALGLVNAYLKRCIKMGLLKASEAPARRYIYYITPKGFAEKSKLTVEYLTYSFSFFRQARSDCVKMLARVKQQGCNRVVLAGASDLAEIVRICGLESGVEIVAVVEPRSTDVDLSGVPIVKSFDEVAMPFDAVVITDVISAHDSFQAAAARFGIDRVFAPTLLDVNIRAEVV